MVAGAEPDELDAELAGAEPPDAGCDASAEASDFFERFFFVVVALESVLLSAAAELEAGAAVASAEVSDFFVRFFLVVVVLESADAEVSAVAG